METTRFMDLDCIRLANEAVEVIVTQSVGPRLISFGQPGGENILAELPGATLECPGEGLLNLWGGHRLWHAPEMARRTYLPDDQPLTVEEIGDGLHLTQPTEPQTGIQKAMRITLPDDSAGIVIDHTLKNEGMWPVELAPWAITQLKPGGVAILPQPAGPADPDGLLPNRRLALWPYTDIGSPHIQWGNRFIFVHATMKKEVVRQDAPRGEALKLGFPNRAGWLAYYIDRTLFVKQAPYQANADYFDFGSSSECYCRAEFIELETLGPRTVLAPGQAVSHRESWRLFPNLQFEATEEAAQTLVEKLGL